MLWMSVAAFFLIVWWYVLLVPTVWIIRAREEPALWVPWTILVVMLQVFTLALLSRLN